MKTPKNIASKYVLAHADYLKQLKLSAPWKIFFVSIEIEWIDWDEEKDRLEAAVSSFINITELDKKFIRLRCPEGFLLVGAMDGITKDIVYGFVKAYKP